MYVLSIVVCPFVLFLLVIVLSVLLQFKDYDYPFGIFKVFLRCINSLIKEAAIDNPHSNPANYSTKLMEGEILDIVS
jgi:hypothetical protein